MTRSCNIFLINASDEDWLIDKDGVLKTAYQLAQNIALPTQSNLTLPSPQQDVVTIKVAKSTHCDDIILLMLKSDAKISLKSKMAGYYCVNHEYVTHTKSI